MGSSWTTKKIRFSESQIQQLEKNHNVAHVSERSVAYQPAFKLAAIKPTKRVKHRQKYS